MCIAPIYIVNPYKSRGLSETHKGKKLQLNIGGRFDYLHDTISQYISVPCGQCQQCVSTRQNFYLQRIQMESLRSELFYFTLTYANRGLKFTNVNNYNIPYPYFPDIQNLFKRLRKLLPHTIRTFVVSEYGTNKHRPHFHGFIAVSKDDIKKYYYGSHFHCEKHLYKLVLANWKRNTSSSHRYPLYMPLCDFVVRGKKRTYDLHWVEPIINHDNDVSYYVTKYLIKYDERTNKLLYKIRKDSTLTDEQTKELTSLIKPRCVLSKDFGSYKLSEVSSYIKRCVSRCSEYPSFYDINTGKSMLLAPYYRKRFVDLEYKFNQYWKYLHEVQYLNIDTDIDSYNPDLLVEDIIHEYNVQSFQKRKKQLKFRKVKNLLIKKQ